jgi:hypothetical protein
LIQLRAFWNELLETCPDNTDQPATDQAEPANLFLCQNLRRFCAVTFGENPLRIAIKKS